MLIAHVLPNGIQNAPYLQTLNIKESESLSATGLPTGLTMSPEGEISGAPTETGAFTIEITGSNTKDAPFSYRALLTILEAQGTCQLEGQDETLFIAFKALGGKGTLAKLKAHPQNIDAPRLIESQLEIEIADINVGSAVEVTLAYPEPLAPDAQYIKFGPTPDNSQPHEYILPGSRIQGNIATFTLIDGGCGDDDLTANGSIVDPGGPGVPPGGINDFETKKVLFIHHYHVNILERNPTSSEEWDWAIYLSEQRQVYGNWIPGCRNMGYFLYNAPEYLAKNTTKYKYVTSLYEALLGRTPASSERDYWIGQLNAGMSRNTVLNCFLYSTEYTNHMINYWGC